MLKIAREKTRNFLIWTQKWTKTDMIYLAKGSFWLTFERGTISLIALASALVFGNLISEELYGTYKYILSTIGLLGITTMSGMHSVIIKSSAQNCDGDFKKALKIRIKWGFLGFIGGVALGLYYLIKNDISLGVSFLIFSLFIPFMDSFNLYTSFLNGKKEFKKLSKINIINRAITTSCVLAVLIITKNVFFTVFTLLFTTTFLRFIASLKILKKIPKEAKSNYQNLKFGKNLSFLSIVGKITTNIDNMLIFYFLGAKEVAIYNMALLPVLQITNPLGIINTLSFPKLSEKNKDEIKKTLPTKLIKMTFILFIVYILYVIISPYIFTLLLPRYIESVKYSQIYALSFLLIPASILEQTLISQAKEKEIYILKTALPFIKIALFIILLPTLKIWGMITALLLIMLIHFIIVATFFKKL